MWIMTNRGFLSVTKPPVHDRRPDGELQVRSRDHGTLTWFRQSIGTSRSSAIVSTPGRDYQYRVYVQREAFGTWLGSQAADIDYTNFKDSIRGRKLHDLAMDIWSSVWRAYRRPIGTKATTRKRFPWDRTSADRFDRDELFVRDPGDDLWLDERLDREGGVEAKPRRENRTKGGSTTNRNNRGARS